MIRCAVAHCSVGGCVVVCSMGASQRECDGRVRRAGLGGDVLWERWGEGSCSFVSKGGLAGP